MSDTEEVKQTDRGAGFFGKLGKNLVRINKILSPSWSVVPEVVVRFAVMFLASALVMSLETIQFHSLMYILDYIKATSIISIALMGIAIGGFLAFALAKFPQTLTMFVSAILLFFSLILSYFSLLQVTFGGAYLLILPFIFASFIISVLFTRGNSNAIYFTNLVASGLGVMIPIFLIPAFKSETSLFILAYVPLAILLLFVLRIPNIVLKLLLGSVLVFGALSLHSAVDQNLAFPDQISATVFEQKILSEMGDATARNIRVNYALTLFQKAYKKNELSAVYEFVGDDYDRDRTRYFLEVLGFVERFTLPGLDLFSSKRSLNPASIDAKTFENEVIPAINRRYSYFFSENYDLSFLGQAYTLKDGNYVLSQDYYARMRAKYLLGDLGHFRFFDFNFDLPRNEFFSQRMKYFNENLRVTLSEDSTVGRVDYTSNTYATGMAINGTMLDNIDPYNGNSKDPRVPHLGAGKVFIVGLSADGIVKSARRLPGTTVSGVELNPIIWRTMTDGGYFQTIAADPYKTVEGYQTEARTFLATTKEKYKMITLMNIHADHGAVATLGPENFHTVESTKLLLSKLEDGGLLDFEEIVIGPRSEWAFLKFMNTLKQSLVELGVAEPDKCIHVFKWAFFGGSAFRTVSVKAQPFTKAEEAAMDEFMAAVIGTKNYSGVELVYSPYKKLDTVEESLIRHAILPDLEPVPNSIAATDMLGKVVNRLGDTRDARFLLARYWTDGVGNYVTDPAKLSGYEKDRIIKLLESVNYPVKIDLSPVRDDSPFPYNVYVNKAEVTDILFDVMGLSLFLFVPLLVLLLRSKGQYSLSLWTPVTFSAITGLGFMLVEIVLMQRFQVYLGDPTLTLVVVLGGMLVFSGFGSLVSQFFPRWLVLASTALIPIILLSYSFWLGPLLAGMSQASQADKIWMTLALILPLAFVVGIPFPKALGLVRERTSDDSAALMFGVSGVFSTLGSVLAIVINITAGFQQTFQLGSICYTVGLLLFCYLVWKTREKAA